MRIQRQSKASDDVMDDIIRSWCGYSARGRSVTVTARVGLPGGTWECL